MSRKLDHLKNVQHMYMIREDATIGTAVYVLNFQRCKVQGVQENPKTIHYY